MLYSKDDILTAVREELAEANKTLGIADGFTDNDYKYLGVIAAAWERLLIRLPNGSKPPVSGSLLSEANLERCSNLYAEAENNAYTNDYFGYYNGAKQMGNSILNEIQRRQLLIKSEPNGIVRETMINNLLLDI